MNAPSRIFVCLAPAIIFQECFVASVMMAMNWIELGEIAQVNHCLSDIHQQKVWLFKYTDEQSLFVVIC